MKKVLFIIMMFMFINVQYANAKECTENKLKELKELAENITISSEFYAENIYLEDYTTNVITIQGLTNGFYIYSPDRVYRFDYNDNINGIIEDTITSDIKKLYVYNNICPNEIIREIKLSLKTFNKYSEYDECKDISEDELEICGKYYDKALDEKEFYEIIEEYNKQNEKNNDGINDEIKNYLIIGCTIAVVAIIVVLIIRRKRNILD